MMSRRERRTVTLSVLVPRVVEKGGRTELWAFGYADLAALLGCSERTVRRMVNGWKRPDGRRVEPTLDPGELEALCRRWMEKQGK